MKAAENIERLIRKFYAAKKSSIATSAKMDKKVLDDASQALEKSNRANTANLQPNIWRIIATSKIAKFAVVMVIIFVLAGICQLGGGHAALAQTTKAVRVTLSRLKEFIAEMSRQQTAPPSQLEPIRVRHVDITKPFIQFDLCIILVQGGQDNLQNFFEEQDIEFVPIADKPDVYYAILAPDIADRFTEFSQSTEGLELLSAPRVTVINGEEAILVIDELAFAVAGTLLEDNDHIDLSFAFLDGQVGFEIPSIRIKTSEAVLVRVANTVMPTEEDGTAGIMFVLVRMEKA